MKFSHLFSQTLAAMSLVVYFGDAIMLWLKMLLLNAFNHILIPCFKSLTDKMKSRQCYISIKQNKMNPIEKWETRNEGSFPDKHRL